MPNTPRHTFGPFEALLARVQNDGNKRWASIEDEFIRAVELFDTDYSKGGRSTGWYAAKARYFNDLIVELLANVSEPELPTISHENGLYPD
jgi:hypothetical protein